MNAKKIVLGTGIAAVAVAGAVFAWTAVSPNSAAYAAGLAARQVGYDGPGVGRHGPGGWGHGPFGHRGPPFAMICSDERDARLERGLSFVEGFVGFTAEQTATWNELAQAIRAGSDEIGKTCDTFMSAEAPKTAPERLARVESVADTGVGIIKRVRPAFDKFYASLSDKQKKALDDLMAHHGRRS